MAKDKYYKHKDKMEFLLESWMRKHLSPEAQCNYIECTEEDYEKFNLTKYNRKVKTYEKQ